MKTGLFCIAAGAVLALAQPHRYHHQKREDVVVHTEVSYVNAPAVVVIVDANGNPISTSTRGQQGGHRTRKPHRPHRPTSKPKPSQAPAPTTYAPAPPASTYSASQPTSTSESGSGSGTGNGYGIVYSPYNNDGSCKTADQVSTDIAAIDDGYSVVRIYGTDCDQVNTVFPAVKAKGIKLFAGVWDVTNVDSDVQCIIDAASSDWSVIDTVAIGNEGVQLGRYSVSAVVDALNSARSKLRSANYNGPVVTVDTSGAIMANPELCTNSDYAAANCHAFFNANIDASGAGAYVLSQAQAVSQACGGMDTRITESGWPSQGSANGAAVPSPDNQKAAISSLKSTFSSNIILFSAYNDYWKQDNAYTFGAEHYYGIQGDAPTA